MTTRICVTLIATGLAVCLAGITPAQADVAKCQRNIAKASQKFLAARSKALASCQDNKIAGSLPPSTVCHTESKTAFAIGKASAKARIAMAKSCCGPDHVCGTAPEEALTSIGWGSTTQCPNFESGLKD